MTKAAFAVSISLALTLSPSLAGAEGAGQALIRGLDSPIKRHPLAGADGRVPVLVNLAPGQTAASLGMREIAKGVGSARMSPDEVFAFDDQHPDVSLSAGPPMRTMLDVSSSWTGAKAFRQSTGSDGKGVIVGVVDTGIDLTHPGFITADQHTRVAWLLTWGAPQGLHPDVEEAMGCTDPSQSPCAVYSAADIDAVLQLGGSLPEDMHDLAGHGTHVAGIAAGNGRTSDGSAATFIGMAPGATLVVAAPTHDEGFPDDAVIRGAQFIFNRADAMGLPAVANFSLGGDYGPHDGTSPVEKALTSLIGDDKPGRAIVVAAGNSGSLYTVGKTVGAGIRTEVRLDDHAPVRVPVLVPNSTSGQVYVWISYHKTDRVSVGLEGPNGKTWIGHVSSGDDAGYDDGAGTTASVINNEDSGKTALNQDNAGAIVSFDGKWAEGSTFAIRLSGQGDVDLWATATGQAGSSGVYFPNATKAGTISVPATAPNLLAVGCSINRVSWRSFVDQQKIQVEELPPDSICYYSSAGPTPTGVPKPEILAPGGYVASALSIDADPRLVSNSIFDGSHDCPSGNQCFVTAQDYVVTAGTSMSTPHVAGAIALLFQNAPNLTQSQATQVLQASARFPTGTLPYDSQVGPGALDMSQALAVMADEVASSASPDSQKSWWLLSDELARPDGVFPVWGTIELRLADGSVASGLDGNKLTISVDNGAVVNPVEKVKQGLFRFAVAGAKGIGGSKMHIRVLYDGVPVGQDKDLAVATDPWVDASPPTALGGCQSGHGRPSDASVFALALFTAGLASRKRRGSSAR